MEKRRDLIRLLALKAGMNYYDIADALGLSYYTVKQYLAPSSTRGPTKAHLKMLKNYLKERKNER